MDPQAAYDEWTRSTKSGDLDSATEHALALVGWLKSGGFEPKWTEFDKIVFMFWVSEYCK